MRLLKCYVKELVQVSCAKTEAEANLSNYTLKISFCLFISVIINYFVSGSILVLNGFVSILFGNLKKTNYTNLKSITLFTFHSAGLSEY